MKPQAYRLVQAPRKLEDRFFGRFHRVGLRGVLADTNRLAVRAEVPGAAVSSGLTWQRSDAQTKRWYPQGITTSADAYGAETGAEHHEGRPVVIVSWYGHGRLGWLLLGARISVLDVSDEDAPRYRHVLLVAPRRFLGINWLRPVRVHAGGIVWYGRHLYVAGTKQGLLVFRLDDVLRVQNRARTSGYRYVLPQFTTFTAENDPDAAPMTYSFMSLDRAGPVDHLVAGEYGRKGGTHRLMRFALDRETQLLSTDHQGHASPASAFDRQVERMQGAALVGGTWVLTASRGAENPGDLWVGQPGKFVMRRGVLPPGPEDITFWPVRGELWSLSEWPGQRWVFAIDAKVWAVESHRSQ